MKLSTSVENGQTVKVRKFRPSWARHSDDIGQTLGGVLKAPSPLLGKDDKHHRKLRETKPKPALRTMKSGRPVEKPRRFGIQLSENDMTNFNKKVIAFELDVNGKAPLNTTNVNLQSLEPLIF